LPLKALAYKKANDPQVENHCSRQNRTSDQCEKVQKCWKCEQLSCLTNFKCSGAM